MVQYKKIKSLLKNDKSCINILKNIYIQELLGRFLPFLWLIFILDLCVTYFVILMRIYNSLPQYGFGIMIGIVLLLMLIFMGALLFKIVLSAELTGGSVLKLNTALSEIPLNFDDLGIDYSISNSCVYYSVCLSMFDTGFAGIYPMSSNEEAIPDVVFTFRKIGVNHLPFGNSGYSLDVVFTKGDMKNEEVKED